MATFAADSIVQRIWDPLYIDALIAMQTDLLDSSRPPMSPPDGDFTNANILYSIADRKYDVIAMMTSSAAIPEWVRYSAYGVARHLPLGDANHDGMVNGSDQGALLVNWGQTLGAAGSFYNPDFDLNRDGTIDGADQGILLVNWKPAAEPQGQISTLGNTVGYSGYIYDEATNLSLARFRWYDATEGRWITRDPIEYIGGTYLYQYVIASPLGDNDPMGLFPSSIQDPRALPILVDLYGIKEAARMAGISVAALVAALELARHKDKVQELIDRYKRQSKGKGKCELAKSAVKQAEKSIKKLNRRIKEHQDQIRDPFLKLPRDTPQEKINQCVDKKWPSDIRRQQREIQRNKDALDVLKENMRKACAKPWWNPVSWF